MTKQAQKKIKNNAPSSEALAQEEKIKSLQDRLARALADYQNLEKRFSRESSTVIQFANASLVQKLLTVRDHLEMACSHLQDPSLTMILTSFDKVLEEEGVKEVKAEGDFDPNTMECQEQAPGVPNQVIKVIQKGFLLHDRVIRPARVIVGNGQPLENSKPEN